MHWLVVCGLDDALLGDAAALIQINEEFIKRRDKIILVYLTGRSLSSVLDLRYEVPLLPADFLICDGGTSLWQHQGESYTPLVEWMNQLNRGWSRSRIEAIAHGFNLVEQAASHQTPFKCSYYLAENMAPYVLDPLQEQIEAVNAHLVYRNGFLDILPTDEAEVVDYLRNRLAISENQTVVCNAALEPPLLNIRSILVPPVPLAASRNGSGVYYAQAPFAQGILEGLRYWGFIPY